MANGPALAVTLTVPFDESGFTDRPANHALTWASADGVTRFGTHSAHAGGAVDEPSHSTAP